MLGYDELIKNINILLADDDEDYMMMTYSFLTQVGYKVDKVNNGKDALEKLKTNRYQIALLDYFMPGFTGEQVIEEIRKTNKEIIIILQTGFSGQNPPVQTMQKLNIQNYYDKTEGIDRLNLELISAVKIFNQQNEILLTNYKTNAIGNLISGVAQEIKSTLLTVSAGLELTNLSLRESDIAKDKERMSSLNKYYERNKESLGKIDKVLSSIINQSTANTEYIMSDIDVVDIMNAILSNQSKISGINVNVKCALKPNSYINGGINDTIFIACEFLRKLIEKEERGSTISVVLDEDVNNWYINIFSDKLDLLPQNDYFVMNRLMISIKDASIQKEDDKVSFILKK
mgnify:CR=1 FL=1